MPGHRNPRRWSLPSQVTQRSVPGLGCQELHAAALRFTLSRRVPWVAEASWEVGLGLFVENVHFVLVETFGAAKLKPPLPSSEIQVFFCVSYMLAPVTHKYIVVNLEDKPWRFLRIVLLGKFVTMSIFVSSLVAFKVGSPTRSETLLTAEAFHLAAHAQRVALDSNFLAPGAQNLNI